MRRLLIFLFLFFFLSSVNSQDLRNGTYVGDKTTDFLIVSNDSICFRLLTSSGLFVSTIGIGTYSYADGSLYVKTCERIYQATTEITMIERTDSLFSFRVLDSDNNPLRIALYQLTIKTHTKRKSLTNVFSAGFLKFAKNLFLPTRMVMLIQIFLKIILAKILKLFYPF